MTHDEIQDLLEAYVDETLDRRTRAEVDRHLAGCTECRAILDGVPAVDLGRTEPEGYDERAMRRAVRRTLLRLAANVVVLGLAALVAVALLGWFVFQPLVVDRGWRAQAAHVATQDLAALYHPGTAVTGASFRSGIATRTSEAELTWPLGAELLPLGTERTRLGPLALSREDLAGPFPEGVFSEDVTEQLTAVGAATVATVELHFDTPLSLQRAAELAASPADVRVVWAGFPTDAAEGLARHPGLGAGGFVGFSTCDSRDYSDMDMPSTGGSSGTWSGTGFTLEVSVQRALDAVRGAVGDLAEQPFLAEGWDPDVDAYTLATAQEHLDGEPGVAVLVVTGPTPELLGFLDEAGPDSAAVRDIDFNNWYQPLCGR